MKKGAFIIFLLVGINVSAQYNLFNSFEGESNLAISIDTSNADNIWQIGRPQKFTFQEAFSEPKAIVTDTLSFYPVNNTSSFTVHVDITETSLELPYILLSWKHKMEVDPLSQEGGLIEVSYDSMQTWINVLSDEELAPEFFGYFNTLSLENGDRVINQVSGPYFDATLCWSTVSLEEGSELDVRFTFFSDSLEQSRDGWLIDNFHSYGLIFDAVEDRDSKNIEIFPVPTSTALHITSSDIEPYYCMIIGIHGDQWPLQKIQNQKIDVSSLQTGMYHIIFFDHKKKHLSTSRFVKD